MQTGVGQYCQPLLTAALFGLPAPMTTSIAMSVAPSVIRASRARQVTFGSSAPPKLTSSRRIRVKSRCSVARAWANSSRSSR